MAQMTAQMMTQAGGTDSREVLKKMLHLRTEGFWILPGRAGDLKTNGLLISEVFI